MSLVIVLGHDSLNDPQAHASTSGRTWRVYAALGAAAILAYYLLPRASWAQAVLLTTVNAVAVVATLCAAVRASRFNRLAWAALSAGMTLATLANGPYYAYRLITGHALPFPGPVDVLWLMMYPCFVVALLAIGRERGGRQAGDLLDAAILTVAGGTLMWVCVLGPILRVPAESALARTVSVAYPAMDLIVFAVLMSLLVSGLSRSGASRLLLASFTALLTADLVYAFGLLHNTYAIGGPTDGLWMASYVLVGAAAVHPAARALARRSSMPRATLNKGRLAFLSLAVLTGPSVLIFDSVDADVAVVAAASAITFLLVMARLTGLNWRLTALGGELEAQATTDALTGLLNRSAFSRATVAALDNGPVGMLMIDLDDFKRVNDLAGHAAGDAVLVEVAQRMRATGRSSDVMARLGGDEFAVLIIGDTDARAFGERLIQALRIHFAVDGRVFTVGASIGFVEASAEVESERLAQQADIAMYSAKEQGKNRIVAYRNSMYTDAVQRVEFAQELAAALDRDEMHVAYQPIVRLGDRAVVGFEALVRWTHPRFGEVPPDRFIPVAEETGAIVRIGLWVLRTALRDFARMQAESERALRMNVNVSVVQLLEPAFTDEVGAALDIFRVRADQLVLEVTEGAFINETSIAGGQLRDLHALGIRIAVDDFGTGYSSLAYLQRLPVEELKIDRFFVDGIDNGRPEGSAARAIVRMCDSLGLRCVAEGIERESQIAPLTDAGCELAQGFLFGRPMPSVEALRLLRAMPSERHCDGDRSRLASIA